MKVKIEHAALQPESEDEKPPDTLPPLLLALLNHLHISVEASYIPPVVEDERLPPRTTSIGRLSAQSRTSSLKYPQTPHPTPSTRDADKRYTYTEGAPLATIEWGKDFSDKEIDVSFAVVFDEEDKSWLAFYKLAVSVSK